MVVVLKIYGLHGVECDVCQDHQILTETVPAVH